MGTDNGVVRARGNGALGAGGNGATGEWGHLNSVNSKNKEKEVPFSCSPPGFWQVAQKRPAAKDDDDLGEGGYLSLKKVLHPFPRPLSPSADLTGAQQRSWWGGVQQQESRPVPRATHTAIQRPKAIVQAGRLKHHQPSGKPPDPRLAACPEGPV